MGYKKTPGVIILGLAALTLVTLAIAFVVLMQEPQSSQSQVKGDGGKVDRKQEIVRLPEELTAEFQYSQGWWVANGPADDDAMRRLTNKQRRINNVSMNQAAVSAKGLDELIGHQVQALDLIDSDIDVSMAKSISRFSGLKNLLLKDHCVSDEVMKAITGPRSLESLLLKNSPVTVAGLEHLPSVFPDLKSLTFMNCKNIDDSIIPVLVKCHKLESLEFIATSMTADGVVKLVSCLPIVHLSFEQHGRVDDLTDKLQGPKLTSLCLRGNVINDRVVARLCEMKRLKSLVLTQCSGLTNEQLTLLKEKLPGCKIRSGKEEAAPELGLVEE